MQKAAPKGMPQDAPAFRPLLGALLIALAVLGFTAMDAVTKHLTQTHPVSLILAARYAFGLVILLALFLPRIGAELWRADRLGLQLLRGLILSCGSFNAGWAFKLLPLAEAMAIIFLTPLIVLVFARPLLGERVTALGWALTILGFVGVLIVMRPGGELDFWGVVFATLCALCASGYHLTTRFLKGESTISLLFYVTLVGTFFFIGLATPHLGRAIPSLTDLGWMTLVALLSIASHFLFGWAYQQAPASLIAPVAYVHLVWAVFVGWAVFGDFPTHWSLVGIAIILVSGVGVAIMGHLHKNKFGTK